MNAKNKTGVQMPEQVSAYIQQLHMIQPGEKVLVGLSGGADSVCLFYLLLSLKELLSFSVEAVHVNHMLRETASRDELFVTRLCEKEGIVLHTLHADVAAIAKQQGLSFEEAGRNVRYSFFEEVAVKTGADKIAVAHHANDRAETILFRLSRGTGVGGLAGIRPVRDKIIRPLLCTNRQQIEAYLLQCGYDYMTDETNMDNHYSRNRLRNEVLPILEDICGGATQHIANAGEMAAEVSDYLKCQVTEAVLSCTSQEEAASDSLFLLCGKWNNLHSYLQGEVIRECIFRLAGSKKDISKQHVEAVIRLAELQVGSKYDLPYSIEVVKSYETLIFRKKSRDSEMPAEPGCCIRISKEDLEKGTYRMLPDGRKMTFKVMNYDKNAAIPTKACTKWFDYDKINEPLMIRTVRQNDFFYFNHKNKKYVKDYMVNEKIPLYSRDKCLIVACGDHMLYFVGKRISHYFKIDETTEKILEIEVTGG